MKTKFLFPNQFKRIGWILLIPSTILGILIIVLDFQLKFLDTAVFTFYTSNLLPGSQDANIFSLIKNNVTGEIAGVVFIIGAILVAFSRQKHEDEFISRIRLGSLVWATYINYAILILCILFFYNFEFLYVMIFNMLTILILFIIRFYYILHKSNSILDHEE